MLYTVEKVKLSQFIFKYLKKNVMSFICSNNSYKFENRVFLSDVLIMEEPYTKSLSRDSRDLRLLSLRNKGNHWQLTAPGQTHQHVLH